MTFKSNLLATKLRAPALFNTQVQRPHLLQRLNQGLSAGRPLTLVSAPAGFGKSACISAWLPTTGRAFSWLSLDKNDDDPWRFLTYLLAALQKIDPNLGSEVGSLLQSETLPPAEIISNLLINDILDLSQPFILVLDDFQMIQQKTNLQIIEDILLQRPQQLHLVLITREDPLLPLARLRAGYQMSEIRVSDLRFSDEESALFLNNIMGLNLQDEDLAVLTSRTEGWVVGLQLAALSVRDRVDSSGFIRTLNGNQRYILSYLTEEVLNRQSPEIQEFLLQTSILEKMNAGLCDAVTGRQNSSVLLERLYAANLFLISLDDEHYWYRYHHLFADLLHSHQSRMFKEQTRELHRRASEWFLHAGLINEAVEHALAGEDFPAAINLIEKHATRLVIQGFGRTLESWMASIPENMQTNNPRADLAYCWMYLLYGKYPKIFPHAERIQKFLQASESLPNEDQSEINKIRAEWFALQSNLLNVQGKPQQSITLAHQALLLIQPDDDYIQGLAYLGLGGAYRMLGDYDQLCPAYHEAIRYSRGYGNYLCEMMAASGLVLMAIQQGQLHLAAEVAMQSIDYHQRTSGYVSPVAGSVYGSLGIVYYQWNQLKKSFEYFSQANHLSHMVGHNAGITYNAVLMARFFMAEGNLDAAEERLREAASLVPLGIPIWLKPEVVNQQVIVFLARHNPAAAEAVLNELNLPDKPAQGLTYPEDLYYLGWLRLLIYKVGQQGRKDLVACGLNLAAHLLKDENEATRPGLRLQVYILRALLQACAGGQTNAHLDLEKAIELAHTEGYIRLFVDEGASMDSLLKSVLPQTHHRAYVETLLAAFPQNISSKSRSSVSDLIDPLTERENDVLRLIAEGLKYEEIAENLVITVNTVRFYVKAIYGKLGVNNRTRAIETARQLNLL
ncbi:MAG: LuxR C-terminal-related transcriptional regulator [Anaerolineae bacterium]|nr:LuxR C-terminal-related transcriptional regulator [Anaerolineae bacterium]